MKKLILFSILPVILFSCGEGPEGPPGRDGLDGEEGFVFDYEFSFTAPDYSVLLELPQNFNMQETDVILVYFLWEVTETNVEVWRPLPQTLYLDNGILEYNYDFTFLDTSVFMDGTVNLDELGAIYTDNWIARVVVLPALPNGRISLDYSDYNQVKAFYGLPESRLTTKGYITRPE